MRKGWALLGSAIFFVIAPGAVAGLVPWWITRWQTRPAFLGTDATRLLGLALVVAGLVPLVESFGRFALKGLGTPAIIAPPRYLVVSGFYRYVRNPMYAGIVTMIFGQALVLGDTRLLWYGAIVWLGFFLFVLGYEEPTLRRRYGAEYENFCAHVPRWLPRLTSWKKAQK